MRRSVTVTASPYSLEGKRVEWLVVERWGEAHKPQAVFMAAAKVGGILANDTYPTGCDFISAMPTNLYGPGVNFGLKISHVVPALMRKAHEAKRAGAKSFEIWGTGSVRREFLHVDDCADALVMLMQHYSGAEHINVGCGEDVTIRIGAFSAPGCLKRPLGFRERGDGPF